MCQTAYYKHPLCGCRWFAITQPCGPGMGFSTCPAFFTGRAKKAPQGFGMAKAKTLQRNRPRHMKYDPEALAAAAFVWSTVHCPVHTLGGVYNRNSIRLIIDARNGLRWGTGPNKGDCGIECKCSVM